MAEWNSNPQWNDLESINGGFNFNSFLDISASDFNKLVENMQYLYKNRGKGEFNMDKIYPEGSIYMTLDPTFNPAEHFGGVWSRLKDRFLLGAGEYSDEHGSKGGEATHKLTTNEMPNHSHGQTMSFYNSTNGSWVGNMPMAYGTSGTVHGLSIVHGSTYTKATDSKGTQTQTNKTGDGQPHNNMPPYLAVYMWQRTA